MTEIKGATLLAKCLQQQGVRELFGVVGYPITEIAFRAQEMSIRYIGTRHEQTAGFAAQTAGYLRRHVGVALTTTGPGATNAVTALGNAWANGFPLIVISGGADTRTAYRGAFQEGPQMQDALPFCKWTARIHRVEDIPRLVAQGIRMAWHGRAGPVYLEMPADVIGGTHEESEIEFPPVVPPPSRPQADPADVEAALTLLRGAQRPLMIVGKGAVWADASAELRRLVEQTDMPFLTSPMGKGVIPDDHPRSAVAARSQALGQADVILAMGARFNWMLHFGMPPRYAKNVKVIQVDIAPDTLGGGAPVDVTVAGDLKRVAAQFVAALEEKPWRCGNREWLDGLAAVAQQKRAELEPLLTSNDTPMGYYRPLQELQDAMPADAILVAEGANTMDISRSVLQCRKPGQRLDAGTWGTMGVGCGQAIGAAVANPGKRIVALLGDGALGFSGMDLETAVRYKLPITWVVLNNGGIGGGVAEFPKGAPPPVHTYLPGIRYDKLMDAYGARGFHCETPDAVRAALKEALSLDETSLVHIPIDPAAKPISAGYSWLH